MRDWFMQAVATVSGRRTAEGIAEWIREQNVLQDTGITLVRKDSSTLRMTAEEAQEWMRLTPEERREKREKMRQDAEADERLAAVPSDEDVAQMRELYTENPERKWYVIEGEREEEVRLRTSKLGVLNGLLMLERPSYAGLMEVNGVTPEVASMGIFWKEIDIIITL